ncbi:MAG: type III-B CRISPR module RAMP protein Cmr1 [Candidatus Syntropharchaeia archaeon]
MLLKIKTLTPLWTGDVDRECKRIKETGIIGSLRWWYEALVRGLGGYACDPTSERRCELRSVQEALDEQICPACQLFGCTGWSRRFKSKIVDIPLGNLNFFSGIEHPGLEEYTMEGLEEWKK